MCFLGDRLDGNRPMSQGLVTPLLLTTADAVGLVHTLAGPGHYLPFLVLAKARRWSTAKTAAITSACGLGHVGSSILLGLLGILAGVKLERLAGVENLRGQVVSWGLLRALRISALALWRDTHTLWLEERWLPVAREWSFSVCEWRKPCQSSRNPILLARQEKRIGATGW